jgi:hypothetical protein
MQRTELIFHSIWTAMIGVLLIGSHDQHFKEITTPLGILMFLPSVATVIALTVASEWFGRIVTGHGKTGATPAAGPVKASGTGGARIMIPTEDGTDVSITTDGDVSGGVHMTFSEPYNSLGAILTAAEARQVEDALRGIRERAEARTG